MYTGPNIIKDGLLFGYDSGYGVANNHTATRFYKGEPTTNAVPLVDFLDTSNWTGNGWSGAIAVSTDYPNTLELTSTNGWRTYCIDTGITSGGTVSFSYEYKAKSIGNPSSFMMNLNGTHLGSYTNGLGNSTNAELRSGEWTRKTATWTANSDSKVAIGSRGSDGYGLTDVVYVRNFQVELNGHATPFTATSRTATASFIDLKETTDIDVSNVSFDSTGQPTFDGTNDYININKDFGTVNAYTFEWVENPGQTHKMPIAGRTNTNFYKYGAYSWRYKHGGTLGEYYHTAGATSGWHHWVVTYDGSTIKVFQDNISLGTNSSSSGTADFSDGFKIGWWSAGGAYAFNGDIPVMRIYDKALSSTEIKQNYNAYKNRFDI